ncbi:MAG TPA: ABC-F family ATP-binding cassette domain-containing protein [Candidatus Magasanikbacteria bacterium]|nr:ABC-F family ATP-binding cassette domain-containing protein [Candidatus Magasanikbacteria bacterium]
MSTFLTIEKLSKAYGRQVVFEATDLTVNEKQKIGVIGRNGAGKSTLFKIIVGEEQPDSGGIFLHSIAHLGYLQQHEVIDGDQTVLEYLENSSQKETWRCAKIAFKFGLTKEYLDKKISALSGGYLMRLKLTVMLLTEPNIFLLDEPTNFLDVHTQLLLERFLINYKGAYMVVSHDREFLKRTCEQTLEVERGKIFFYPRPIDEFLEYKDERLAFAKLYNKKIDREQKHLQAFVDRFRYKASKAKQAQSKIKAIERLEKVEIDDKLERVRILIPGVEYKKGSLVRTENLSIGYKDKIVAENINLDIDKGEKVAIVGDNGQGKTTLLKTLAGELKLLGGTVKWSYGMKMAYYAQHVPAGLNFKEKVWHYLRSNASGDIPDEEVLKMAGNFLFHEDDLEKEIGVLSGGEKARLCLAGLLLTKSNVLLLDEPTNHLDFETVEALGRALQDFVGSVIFISHNRTFINSVATLIVEVKDGKVLRLPYNFEEYVYRLEQEVDKEEAEVKPNSKEENGQNENDKRQKFEENKILKRKLKRIEENLQELRKEQEKLLKRQICNSQKFLLIDYERMGEIVKLLEEGEEEWLEVSAELEK